VLFCVDESQIPAGSDIITLTDTIAGVPAGVLGFHTQTAGRPWGVVACAPPLDNGSQVLTGDWSVSSILSHEVLELACDPACSFWASTGRRAYALEVCDPVEAPTYDVNGISVSNFTYPWYFDPAALRTDQKDYLDLLDVPFEVLPGGYVVYVSQGKEHQVYGDEFPQWRREMKAGPNARTQRRARQASFGLT
jgi:hypothetical protein